MNDLKNNIEKDLRDKMNFIIKRTEREIKKCSKEIKNLKEMFKKIYLKNNNIYINMMKNIMININQENNKNEYDEYPNIYNNNKINKSQSYAINNSSEFNANNSTAMVSEILNKDNFLNKMKKKEIMIQFLEKEEVKKLIYNYLYDK
jgi:Mn-containing catalase